jgi:hypothetical protein
VVKKRFYETKQYGIHPRDFTGMVSEMPSSETFFIQFLQKAPFAEMDKSLIGAP